MALLLPLLLTAATARAGADGPPLPPPPPRVQAVGQATAEIVRGDTSSLETGAGQARRQVRRRTGGQVAVEFE